MRIERLEDEKAGLTADIREVYAEAKGSGFDTKVMPDRAPAEDGLAPTARSRKRCSTSTVGAIGLE